MIRRCTGRLALMAMLLACAGAGLAQPQELRGALPAARQAGSSRFSVFGIGVYDAILWVEPGFQASDYERHAFALELKYLRDFSNDEITQRSLTEMERQPSFPAEKRAAWEQALRGAFPDVRKGDRIIGVYRPGAGTVFLTNGTLSGTIRDEGFSRRFFGIWLSAHTSEPRLRDALLAAVPAR